MDRKMGSILSKLKRKLINKYTLFILFLLVYMYILRSIDSIHSSRYHFRLEIPFVLYLYYIFNLILRRGKWKPYIAAIPIILAYALYDLYYIIFGRIFRIIEFKELPELIDVLPISYIAPSIMFVIFPLCIFILSIDRKRYQQLLISAAPIFFLILIIEIYPNIFLNSFNKISKEVSNWSDIDNVDFNGRFMMLFYQESKRKMAYIKTLSYRNLDKYDKHEIIDNIDKNGNKKNIHLIVLESFLDPSLLKGVDFTKDPKHKKFVSLFGDNAGFSISPVFGGFTAQAEFELLCGVPAFHELSSVEFNVFTGSKIYCMPRILEKVGYKTIASNSYKPNLYNTIPAYKSIGFSKIYFPKEYAMGKKTYLSIEDITDEKFMFDGILFKQNIEFVSNLIKEDPKQPILNYVLGQYGHFPHEINENKRPSVIETITEHPDEQLSRFVNQYYYRTEAIAEFVNKLIEVDPGAIIIIVSDHLPPLIDGVKSYTKLKYLVNIDDSIYYNRILIIENGKPVKYNILHHYDIPDLIFNYLTDGKHCLKNECNIFEVKKEKLEYFDDYMNIMAHAVDIKR